MMRFQREAEISSSSGIPQTALKALLVFLCLPSVGSQVVTVDTLDSPNLDTPKLEMVYGTAYKDEHRREVLYKERHSTVYDQIGRPMKSIIEYLRPDSPCEEIFANMKSDFTRGHNISVYMFHHIPLRWKEGVDFEDGRFVMFQEENDVLQTKELPPKAALFAGQGWHYHILERLDELAHATKTQKIHLAFPAHLAAYPFALKREWKRGDLVRFSMSFDSWLVSYFAPKIYLT